MVDFFDEDLEVRSRKIREILSKLGVSAMKLRMGEIIEQLDKTGGFLRGYHDTNDGISVGDAITLIDSEIEKARQKIEDNFTKVSDDLSAYELEAWTDPIDKDTRKLVNSRIDNAFAELREKDLLSYDELKRIEPNVASLLEIEQHTWNTVLHNDEVDINNYLDELIEKAKSNVTLKIKDNEADMFIMVRRSLQKTKSEVMQAFDSCIEVYNELNLKEKNLLVKDSSQMIALAECRLKRARNSMKSSLNQILMMGQLRFSLFRTGVIAAAGAALFATGPVLPAILVTSSIAVLTHFLISLGNKSNQIKKGLELIASLEDRSEGKYHTAKKDLEELERLSEKYGLDSDDLTVKETQERLSEVKDPEVQEVFNRLEKSTEKNIESERYTQ
jgi:hypothetical protein